MIYRRGNSRGRALLLAVTAAVAVAAALLSLPAPADAARGIDVGFSEPRFNSREDGKRARWYDLAQQAGGQWARVTVPWRGVAQTRPANPSNPADPAYDFVGVDGAVRDAAKRNMRIMFTIAIAPGWAEAPNRPNTAVSGTWKPNPTQLGNFGRALARRYSGNYPDPKLPGRSLPRVTVFETWNEPNLEAFLSPQREGGKLFAVEHYRRMLNSLYASVHGVQPGATVVAGALSPIGSDGGREPGRARVGPLVFLRDLLCLKEKKRKKGRGTKIKKRPCPTPARFDALSHHPINVDRPPTEKAGDDDAGIAETPQIKRLLEAARKSGRALPRGKKPLWMTEIYWNSNPPKTIGRAPSLKKQAQYIQESLYLLWKWKVGLAILYQVGDEARLIFQSGLYFENGKPKPSLTAFRFPLVANRKSKRKVEVWGRAPAKGKVKIFVKGKRGGFKRKASVRSKGSSFVFSKKLRIRGKAKIRAKLGKQKTLTTKVGKR